MGVDSASFREPCTDYSNTAHEDAYVKCKYMHRDISAGNILIRIVVQQLEEGYSVNWQGVLSDWELAKHTDVKIILQPERTVCLPSTLPCVI